MNEILDALNIPLANCSDVIQFFTLHSSLSNANISGPYSEVYLHARLTLIEDQNQALIPPEQEKVFPMALQNSEHGYKTHHP